MAFGRIDRLTSSVTSPRLRGEVGAHPAMLRIVRRAPGEGDSPRVEFADIAPHPNPLPAKGGEREKRAAAPPTQPNLIPR